MSEKIRLNLGSGPINLEGYIGIDRKIGIEVYPLKYKDETVDEVYASHVLEHFGAGDVPNVLADWFRVLKPGGVIRIGVPDFKIIASAYVENRDLGFPIGSLLMGGQIDEDDFHRTIFDESGLRILLEKAGFIGVKRFSPMHADTTTNPCSLNLEAIKPTKQGNIGDRCIVCMTMPRLNWTYNRELCTSVCVELKIPFFNTTGAYFDQGMERALEHAKATGREYIITIDYDTVFTSSDVVRLITLMDLYPEADAIAANQAKRGSEGLSLLGRYKPITNQEANADLIHVDSAHFGLTVIRASVLDKMSKPWLHHRPGPNGWDKEAIDADVAFWLKMNEVGKLFLAPAVNIGHLQVMVSWVDMTWNVIHQHQDEYKRFGKPKTVRG